jgi:hypothetical protein
MSEWRVNYPEDAGFPTINKYLAARALGDAIFLEAQIAKASEPYLAKGYRIDELEQVYERFNFGEGKQRFLGVYVKQPCEVSGLALWIRRQWRKLFPYQIPKAKG